METCKWCKGKIEPLGGSKGRAMTTLFRDFWAMKICVQDALHVDPLHLPLSLSSRERPTSSPADRVRAGLLWGSELARTEASRWACKTF